MKKELEGVSKGLIDEQWYDHLLLGIQRLKFTYNMNLRVVDMKINFVLQVALVTEQYNNKLKILQKLH